MSKMCKLLVLEYLFGFGIRLLTFKLFKFKLVKGLFGHPEQKINVCTTYDTNDKAKINLDSQETVIDYYIWDLSVMLLNENPMVWFVKLNDINKFEYDIFGSYFFSSVCDTITL